MNDLNTRSQIISTIDRLGKATVTDIVNSLPNLKSRQWVSVLLNELARGGQLARSKSGRFVFYVLPNRLDLIEKKVLRTLSNKNLSEDKVFDQLDSETPFIKSLSESVHSIVEYAFTEMLNNAIEHSQSVEIKVLFEETDNKVVFEVLDKGIGAFKNIMSKKNLNSELEAIQELMKGKTTTLPHSHTGEGIFFTSKISDIFILDSFEYRLLVNNKIEDVFVEKIKSFVGTRIRFEIDKNSNKHLNDVFREYEYEPGSFDFDKTKVYVKLFKAGTVFISRSQARRLLLNLEKYRTITLDFTDIETVGQAFADEVFRVFATKYPEIKVEPINMSEPVQFMVNRSKKSQNPTIKHT